MKQAPTYPPATPEGMALLTQLLEARGVELRVSAGGELLFRDGDNRLSPADRAAVHHYRHDLADWLARPPVADAPGSPAEPDPSGPRCDRCGSAEFVEVLIHDGASVRRDCGLCGRTWGFPVWHGAAD
ncbi:hypothetical protein Pla108_35140 [Botrimarina colliarenosi]|uniref:TubC N-terminal docking domain-containing protein n=1 Tax=Botrimarina colliarenosi TaxID=2528001 RepID=A0A5C6A7F4_9BACT|nr:hypothetical protein [Botrimarina colliarenosi]TWT95366.1 hypothetical protein Pla108_35140 [Botrimarina colliarenosi]